MRIIEIKEMDKAKERKERKCLAWVLVWSTLKSILVTEGWALQEY